jgi:hypothetical protein
MDVAFMTVSGTDNAKGVSYILADHSDDLKIISIHIFFLDNPNPEMKPMANIPQMWLELGCST